MKPIEIFPLLLLLLVSSCIKQPDTNDNMILKEISQNWKFAESGSNEWRPATVPGTIHTDMIDNGLIEDPFYRTNETSVQWIDKKDLEYRVTFQAGQEVLDKENIELIFDGLDTYATVYLNDTVIIEADNMFRSWKADIKELLMPGNNLLRVVFHSPTMRGLEKLKANGYPLPASNDQSENGKMGNQRVSVFTRKAPYHFGWDWGPRLVTSGIWRPVYLKAYDYGKINHVHIIQNQLDEASASLTASVEFFASGEDEIKVSVFVNGKKSSVKSVPVSLGANEFAINFNIENPKLWWPNGMGDQPLYDIAILITNGVNQIDRKQIRTGLRTIKLIQQPDPDKEGKSFYFEVNGRPVFAKGANYIPNDVFLSRVKPDDYKRVIKDAAEANMNMLRVWGGGIYENDLFYDLCDQYGIMVWQDFMYACSMYPGDDAFLTNARIEAEENIKRLTNHACIALWCGNNEIEAAWGEYEKGRGWGWKERYNEAQRKEIWHAYDTLFHHILPKAVKQFSPESSYWHSSPSAGMGKLASYTTTSGDMHYWGVWHGGEPFRNFRKYRARFMSEYGFQSFPELNTVKSYALPEEWDIESDVMAHHQRSGIGNLRIRQYMDQDYRIPDDFEQFLYVSQLLQAEGIKMAIESHRAEKPWCMGSLYWQLNDCWPVASWSGIDYYGRWKALHYFVKKAFEQTIVSTFSNKDNLEVWLLSDATESKEYKLDMTLIDFEGDTLWESTSPTTSNPDSAKLVKKNLIEELTKRGDKHRMVLETTLTEGQSTVYRNLHYFVRPKELQLDNPGLDISVAETDSTFSLTLHAEKLAKNVFLSTDLSTDHFSDNYFDLMPGETRNIFFPKSGSLENFRKSLKAIDLYQTIDQN